MSLNLFAYGSSSSSEDEEDKETTVLYSKVFLFIIVETQL